MRGTLMAVVLAAAAACGPSASSYFDPDAGEDAPANPDAAVVGPPDARPGCAVEICDDGQDNDCDGQVDNGCLCAPGATQRCFTGPAAARGVGACHDGETTCTGALELGAWGPCVGEGLPGVEVCDAGQLDESCDGAANEGCGCTPGDPPTSCGSDVGECAAGTQECVGGVLGPCTAAVPPVAESCNGLDDDCDGVVDNGLVMGCGSTVGACDMGTSTCAAGVWGACEGAVDPVPESCNGQDDDCDGVIDDGTGLACGSDVGACMAGVSSCVGGAYGPCVGEIGPAAELCNGQDDDCDGAVDGLPARACGTDAGDCVAGTQACTGGAWGACMGSVGPTLEDCNGGDEDCDGMTDEGCTCVDGAMIPCGTDVGECVAGVQLCAGGAYGPCMGGRGPVAEICGNGLDDDCDGAADEAADCPALQPPVATCPGTINTMPLATVTLAGGGSDPDGGAVTFQWTVTTRPPGSTSNPTTPTSSSTAFFVDLAGDYLLTLTVTDDEGATASCSVTVRAVPEQDLHVELVWDTVYGDADLHLTQAGVPPASAWFTGSTDCWYGNTNAAWPPPGAAGNARLDIDDTDGYGPENINISTSPAAGDYEIGVEYYCSHGLQRNPGQPTPAPGDGPATATVRVYCGGALVATYPGISLDRTGRFVDVARVTWPGCAGMSVGTRTWTALVQPSAYTQPLHCPLPCTTSSDCGGGEVCTSPCPYTGTLASCCTLAP